MRQSSVYVRQNSPRRVADLLLALRFPSSAADITSALGRQLKNQATCLVGLRPPVAHAGVEDRPIYVPAYRSGDHPFDVKLDPGARRRTRTVSWCHVREREQQVREETAFLDPAAIASRGADAFWQKRSIKAVTAQ